VWIDKETKDALREYAWSIRSDMSKVIRAAIQDIIDNAGDVSVLADVTGMPVANLHINIKAEDEWWASAVAAAKRTEFSFTELVRRRVRKVLHEEGFLA
jgi:hypothetical protein